MAKNTIVDTATNVETLPTGTGLSADQYCSLLVTAVLDHEGFQGSNGVQTARVNAAGDTVAPLKKIWPLSTNGSDGVG